MAPQRHILSFITVILSFISCCTGVRDNLHNYYVEDEFGVDFKAYPSNLMKLEKNVASAKTFNVEDFGAKGDGRTDDTEVCKLCI